MQTIGQKFNLENQRFTPSVQKLEENSNLRYGKINHVWSLYIKLDIYFLPGCSFKKTDSPKLGSCTEKTLTVLKE